MLKGLLDLLLGGPSSSAVLAIAHRLGFDVVQISLASCVGDNGDQQKGTAYDHKGNDSLYRHGITLFGLFAPYLIGTFTDSREVISIGAATLRALMIMLPFVGTTTVIRSTFNAMGKPMFAFGITIVRQLVLYIPFLLLFNQIWGFNGLIHAQPTEEIVCMIFALWLISNRLKKIRS